MGYSSSKEHFSSFHVTQFNWTKTRGLKQRVSCMPLLWGQPFQKGLSSPLSCSAFLLLTLKCLLVHPFAPWPPWISYILCILYTMVETAPLVGSAFAVSSAVTLWKYDGNRTRVNHMEWNVGRQCCRRMYFMYIPLRKRTWFYLKIKSEKQSSLRVRLVWKAVFQIMEKPAAIVKNLSSASRNLHWNCSC